MISTIIHYILAGKKAPMTNSSPANIAHPSDEPLADNESYNASHNIQPFTEINTATLKGMWICMVYAFKLK